VRSDRRFGVSGKIADFRLPIVDLSASLEQRKKSAIDN
jgi:hypothetical protein